MNKLLLATVILLASCYNPWDIPMHGERAGINPDPDIEYVKGQNLALLLFQLDVEEYFGVSLGRTWETAKVFWVSDLCGDNGNYGILVDGKCYAGYMYSCREMYVAISGWDESNVCHTALIHEFAHCLSGKIHWDNDGDHSGEIWDLVPPAAERACIGFKRGDYE